MKKSNWLPRNKENIRAFSYEIDGPVLVAERIYSRLLEIQSNQYVWSDQTLDSVIRTYSSQLQALLQYKTQLNRWQNKKKKRLKSTQYKEIRRLQRQVDHWDTVLIKMLVLAEQLKKERLKNRRKGLRWGKYRFSL
ncbi:hypothetical protein [Shimazuella kribbensis]|uniref:hypothetical protein n=1 Tax=Shimazuella kribbensis TaxID=139808 RepID=UPI000688728C|nr:hypothetical protein [Shimazuella kribbensis]